MPSTSVPEILTWASSCTDEVQNGRQIAAISTVILTEIQNTETSEGYGEPGAQGVTLISTETLSKNTFQIKGPCSRDLPGKAQSALSKTQPVLLGTQENVKVMEHFPGENTSGLLKNTART